MVGVVVFGLGVLARQWLRPTTQAADHTTLLHQLRWSDASGRSQVRPDQSATWPTAGSVRESLSDDESPNNGRFSNAFGEATAECLRRHWQTRRKTLSRNDQTCSPGAPERKKR